MLAAAPLLFPERLARPEVARYLMPNRPSFQGVIVIWQINDWRVPAGSRTGYLTAAARSIEQNNTGVYFELKSMTAAQAEENIRQGIMPDIISYPPNCGFLPAQSLTGFPGWNWPDLREPFTTALEQTPWALPWAGGRKMIFVNKALLRTRKVELKDQPGVRDLLDAAQKAGRKASGKQKTIYALAGPADNWGFLQPWEKDVRALLEQGLLDKKYANMSLSEAWALFREGRAAFYLGTAGDETILKALQQQGKGFEYAVVDCAEAPAAVDVQYLSIFQCEEDQLEICRQFARALLDEKVQRELLEKNECLPVVPLDMAETEESLRKIYEIPSGARAPLPGEKSVFFDG
jgi:hypothetical protein